MGKKRRHPDIEEVLARPWCYYCERDFDDLKILISHQKAKHFKCERCGRRLNTAGGLAVHLNQVHKETLNAVDNALPSRQGLEVEIFGMEGIPDDVRQQHDQRVTLHFWEEDAQRRAATGNPTPGDAQSNAPKKTKFDAGSDLKARLAAFKAKKAAGDTGSGSGSATPMEGAQQIQSPAIAESPGYPMAASPIHALPGAQASPPPGVMNPYAQYQQPPGVGPPGYGPPMPGYPAQAPFQPPYQASPPFSQGPYQSPSVLPANPLMRPGSIPVAPGLPQRPAFSAPSVNAAQFQQMHQGQASLAPGENGSTATPEVSATATSVDDLIASAVKNAMGDKKVKKDKSMNLVFAVDDVCAEEKTDQLPRYASPKRNRVTATA